MTSFDLTEARRRMRFIRRIEEAIAERYGLGRMRCPTHLSIGQEAVAVAVALAAEREDIFFGTHRSHALYLAVGGDPAKLIAELYGKPDGCARGAGGSMHLCAPAEGFEGTSAIVGSSISVALGAAWGRRLKHEPGIVWAFAGDAVPETGQFWEALNAAALWDLPIVFVVEDNGLATATPKNLRQPERNLSQVAVSFGLRFAAEGDDAQGVASVWEAARRCREQTPSLLHVHTQRAREHVGPGFDNWRATPVVADLGSEPEIDAQVEAAFAEAEA